MSAISLFAALALAAVLADPAPAPTAAAPAPADVRVCKNITVTGTRFPNRECHSAAEWQAMQASARELVDKMSTGHCGGYNCK